VWGVTILVNGIVQRLYEVVILGWSAPCPQTYIFLAIGLIAAVCLLLARKSYYATRTGGA
jgi:hypothetical protein